MVETLTYGALSSNNLSAVADIRIRILDDGFCRHPPIRGYKIGG
jgi:hypothetical protein